MPTTHPERSALLTLRLQRLLRTALGGGEVLEKAREAEPVVGVPVGDGHP